MPLGQAAQDLLRLALVVLVGAVEEVDARVADDLVHGARRRFVGVAAEGHGAEAELGDGDAGTAEELGFHGEILTWRREVGRFSRFIYGWRTVKTIRCIG